MVELSTGVGPVILEFAGEVLAFFDTPAVDVLPEGIVKILVSSTFVHGTAGLDIGSTDFFWRVGTFRWFGGTFRGAGAGGGIKDGGVGDVCIEIGWLGG